MLPVSWTLPERKEMAIKKSRKEFEFAGEMEETSVMGFEFRKDFSPSESLDGMQERMDERIKKIRKIKKNNIFVNPFKSMKN